MENNNYLIIRLSSIGDIVLTSALIRSIKSSSPNSNINLVVSKQFYEIVANNPYINNVILYDKSLPPKQNEILKKELITTYKIIDLQNNYRSRVFRKNLHTNKKNLAKLDKHRLEKLAMIYLKKTPKSIIPIPLRYIQTAGKFDIKYDGGGLEFWLPEEKSLAYYPPEKRSFSKNLKKIAIAPSANHYTKQWLPEYFVKLISLLYEKYSCEFVLVGGTQDTPICNKIKELIKNITINVANQSSLLTTARVLDACDLIVTNDTGVMHIAAARRLPVAAIFGSTVSELGFAPFWVKNSISSVPLGCRPCSHIGRDKCPKKHFDCMRKLFPEIVFGNIVNLVDNFIVANNFV